MAQAKNAALKTNPNMANIAEPDRDQPGKKKRKGGIAGLLILVFLIGIACIVLYLCVTQNLFSMRDGLLEMVNSLDPSYVERQVTDEQLKARTRELNLLQEQLDTDRQKLEARQAELDEVRADLAQREANLVPIYRRPLNEEDLADMKSLAKTYANMDAASAAEILTALYKIEDIAAILYYMSEKSNAPILEAMDPGFAAEITEELLRSQS